ncbi:UNVERIFIED_CONTAM: Pathogenesis-related protein 1 [Sesamum calycinum]|uniref:Pathogenesis-related protein 1 n=1 Tax=Sesamum calycinum TaxID=2727403 RepID=A0AAW2STD1_9LAMI
MGEDEKQRKFHQALLQMLYPPPPSPPQDEEEEEKKLIEPLVDLPGEELENEEGCSLPSSSDDSEGGNGGSGKLTRAQRKRLRKKKLKEAASQRRKIIGPLLPGSSDGENNDNVDLVGNAPESVRQNAATEVSGAPSSCSKQNKLKQRRKSKKLAAKKLNSSSIESGSSHQSQGQIIYTQIMARILQLSLLALLSLFHIPSSLCVPATDLDGFIDEYLSVNYHRAEVSVPPLRWNASLAVVASDLADQLAYSITPSDAPPHYHGFGVTTYISCYDIPPMAQRAVWGWSQQKAAYNYTTNSCIEKRKCSDYTQMVWKNSTEFGCSLGRPCKEPSCFPPEATFSYPTLFVCVYSPRGNIRGQRPY